MKESLTLIWEISFYTFGIILLIGIFFLVWFLRWIFGGKDPLSYFPETQAIDSKTLQFGASCINKLKKYANDASSEDRDSIGKEINLMQRLLVDVKEKIDKETTKYHELCKSRERLWNDMHQFVEDMSLFQRLRGKNKNPQYQEGLEEYNNLELRIEEEIKHLEELDKLHFSEFRNRGVFQRNSSVLDPDGVFSADIDTPFPPEEIGDQETKEGFLSAWFHKIFGWMFVEEEPVIQSLFQNQLSTMDSDKQDEALPSLHQQDFPLMNLKASGHVYADPVFSLDFEEDGVLRHYDFHGSVFRGVHFKGVHQYENCDFRQTDLTASRWIVEANPHRFDHCNFAGAQLNSARFAYSSFHHCDFDECQWENVVFYKVKFIRCKMNGVKWEGLDLSQTVMTPDMLTSIDFSGCIALPQNHPETPKKTKKSKRNKVNKKA